MTRVLLGVQHLLGGLLHVPVRLLGEHPAAAAAAAAPAATSRRRKWREWAGKRLARAAHSLPSLAGPPPPPASRRRSKAPSAPAPIWRLPSPGPARSEGDPDGPPLRPCRGRNGGERCGDGVSRLCRRWRTVPVATAF
uniref:Uncharacterized protein n=1 Tax=Oryctolagus cuniculus TaxID=9986 RepID=A0A5F9CL62_RABIT